MKIVGKLVYNVIEMYDDIEKIYEYYLRKEGYGDLYFLYGTPTPCEPIEIGQYIKHAEEIMNWE